MADHKLKQTALGDAAARQLAVATRTVPQLSRITPRWLQKLLHCAYSLQGAKRQDAMGAANYVTKQSSAKVLCPCEVTQDPDWNILGCISAYFA